MKGPDNPNWRVEVQAATPHWGTNHPLTLYQILGTPLYDTDGRNAMEEKRDNLAGVPFQYEDLSSLGRRGSKGNTSAMEAIQRRDTQILQTIADLRRVIFLDEVPTFEGIAMLANAAIMYPNFLVHRADNPVANGEIDPVITGMKKTMRGIARPLQAFQENRITALYSGVEIEEDFSFLARPETFLNYVNEYEMLDGIGIGCPADEINILAALHAVLDKPTGTKKVALNRLGLTEDEVGRLKLLGLVFIMGVLEEEIWRKGEFGLSEKEYELMQQEGADPFQIPWVKTAATIVTSRISEAQRIANGVLGRRMPPDISIEKLSKPKFVREEN